MIVYAYQWRLVKAKGPGVSWSCFHVRRNALSSWTRCGKVIPKCATLHRFDTIKDALVWSRRCQRCTTADGLWLHDGWVGGGRVNLAQRGDVFAFLHGLLLAGAPLTAGALKPLQLPTDQAVAWVQVFANAHKEDK